MQEKCLKICLMSFNIICLFVGIITFTFGCVIQFSPSIQNILKSASETASSTNLGVLSVIMLAIGGLVILVSFVGCCGVMSESKCMIGLYCLFLILMLIGQVVIGGLGLYYGKQTIEDQVEKEVRKLIEEKDTKVLDSFQSFLKCCGYDGPDDYPPPYTTTTKLATTTAEYNNSTASTIATTTTPTTTISTTTLPPTESTIDSTNVTVGNESATTGDLTKSTTGSPNTTYYTGNYPDSCCDPNKNMTICHDHTMTKYYLKGYLYEEGCKKKVNDFVQKYAVIIGGVAIGFAILEMLSIIAGCMLYKSLD